MNAEILKGHLDLLLLSAVATGPLHGYAIIESLRARSGGAIALAEGTAYPALHRLEEAGLLKSRWSSSREAPRRRRVYELTSDGRSALAAQARTWRSFSSCVNGLIGRSAWNLTT